MKNLAPEKTFTFLKISSIDPENIEKSTPITIELTAQQVIIHKRHNTEIWRNYIQVEDKQVKMINEENINRNNKLENEEELNNQRAEFAARNEPKEEIDLASGDFDPFINTEISPEISEKQHKKRGRKSKNK